MTDDAGGSFVSFSFSTLVSAPVLGELKVLAVTAGFFVPDRCSTGSSAGLFTPAKPPTAHRSRA